MKNKENRIYIITVMEKLEKDDYGWPEFGSTRTPGYYFTFKQAEKAVKENRYDISEACYPYAMIEELCPGLYRNHSTASENRWYKYNKEKDIYEEISAPIFSHNFGGFGPIC